MLRLLRSSLLDSEFRRDRGAVVPPDVDAVLARGVVLSGIAVGRASPLPVRKTILFGGVARVGDAASVVDPGVGALRLVLRRSPVGAGRRVDGLGHPDEHAVLVEMARRLRQLDRGKNRLVALVGGGSLSAVVGVPRRVDVRVFVARVGVVGRGTVGADVSGRRCAGVGCRHIDRAGAEGQDSEGHASTSDKLLRKTHKRHLSLAWMVRNGRMPQTRLYNIIIFTRNKKTGEGDLAIFQVSEV